MSEGKYADYVEAVLKECPDADTGEIEEAFAKYENEFYIPPQDAMRSVLRRFKSGTTPAPQGGSNRTSRETKKSPRCPNSQVTIEILKSKSLSSRTTSATK